MIAARGEGDPVWLMTTRGLRQVARRDFLRWGLGAMAGSALLGCDFSSGETAAAPDPRLTARPGAPTLTHTVGMTRLGLSQGRDGLLYVPESYSPDIPAPLFIGLHGAGGAGDNWASYPARAEARGMIFLAPDSRGTTWDMIRGVFGPDVEFLDQALQHTFDRCRIDPARVTLGGFSDGATYALSLGVSNGDLFSHLIAYSPGFMSASDPIVGKPAVYVSHGSNDNILPRASTSDRIVPSLEDDGYDVTYDQFTGGHEVPPAISDTALNWFLGRSVSGR